jgi:DNA-binding beta-propeller fold protein YncE
MSGEPTVAAAPEATLSAPPEATLSAPPEGPLSAAPEAASAADALVLEPPFADGGAPPDSEGAPEWRRRRTLLLVLLLAAVVALLLFGGWYLLSRKPISEFPLPGIATEPVPHYSYSIYDVTAPTGVAVTADGGRIYASQSEGDRQVIAFDPAGQQIASLKPPATAGGNHVPVYVAINPLNGDVYVSDRPAATIYIYSADGTYLRAFDPGPDLKGWAPLGIAFDRSGNLFATSVGAPFQAVHEFGPDGTFIRTFGKPEEFSFPNGVAVDPAGKVYVSDSNNGRLVVFDRDGNELAVVPRGAKVGELGLPRGTAIDDAGRVYVADVTQQGVQIYHALTTGDSQPKYLGHFGEEGSQDGGFRLPNAVAVDGRSRVYVADWRNNRIQIWTY